MTLAQGEAADPWEVTHTYTQRELVAGRQPRKGCREPWAGAPAMGQGGGRGSVRAKAVSPAERELSWDRGFRDSKSLVKVV